MEIKREEKMIIYDRINKNIIKVILNGKIVGKIKGESKNGWRYYPNEHKIFNKKFNTIKEVKKSIETI